MFHRGEVRGFSSDYQKNSADFTFFCFLILYAAQLLDVDCVLFSEALQHGGLVELLTTTEFLNDASLLVLTLEFLQRALDVLAFLNRYYDHVVC